MLLWIKRTGRKWGDKREPTRTSVSIVGLKACVTESDIWEGPTRSGEEGHYYRAAFLDLNNPARDDRLDVA